MQVGPRGKRPSRQPIHLTRRGPSVGPKPRGAARDLAREAIFGILVSTSAPADLPANFPCLCAGKGSLRLLPHAGGVWPHEAHDAKRMRRLSMAGLWAFGPQIG
jgi:hypothetical protein